MRWTSLGHASWLVETGGLRILCDPVLGDVLHGGLHVAHPPRDIDLDGLAPDVILVSHVHPDHFDPASLAALAHRHPETPVLAPDPLVLEAARTLGFRHVADLPPGRRITLGGATVLTTRSAAPHVEWGVVVADASGAAWDQVDSVLDARDVAGVHDTLGRELGRRRLDLVFAHWCPLVEVEAVLGGPSAFPAAAWAGKLAAVRALECAHVVPAAAGFRHLAPFAWRDAHVFPATEAMLARDLAIAGFAGRVHRSGPGLVYEIDGGEVAVSEDRVLVSPRTVPALAPWRPVEVPPVVDPALGGETADGVLAEVRPWLGALGAAIATAVPGLGVARPLHLVLDVVLPGGDRCATTFAAGAGTVELRPGVDPDHDAVVEVAGSMLADVIAGRRHWGEPLLAGLLRGARRLPVLPPLFPYWALGYRESNERWVRHEVARLVRGVRPLV